jgi:hypothetical protein
MSAHSSTAKALSGPKIPNVFLSIVIVLYDVI